MAYDEGLAERVRDALPRHVTEKKMFGGLCFLDRGDLCCGIVGDDLMLRMGEAAVAALEEPFTRPMDFTGRPMKGMLYVAAEGVADDDQLRDWTGRALAFTAGLPAKWTDARPRRAWDLGGTHETRGRSAAPALGTASCVALAHASFNRCAQVCRSFPSLGAITAWQ